MKRKIIWLVCLVCVLILLFVAYLWWQGGRTLAQDEAAIMAEETSFVNDEDGDGLAGWEEDLWQTDRTKTDTDGDGTSDGDEVKNSRNPRQAGPNDELSEPADQAIVVAAKAIEEKQAPLARLEPATISKTHYTLVDLKLTASEASATITTYKSTMTKLLDDYVQNLAGDENEAMYSAMAGNNAPALALIERSRQHIQSTLSRLLVMPVPVSASLLHLSLVNNLASLGQIIYNMSQVESEPLLAVESAQLREQKYLGVISAITALNRYIAKKP